jgi:hypothetical protein
MSSINDTIVDALIINELTKTKYNELLENNNVNENEIYLVTDDTFDSDGNPIVNVGDPENDTDAANKKYVDEQILVLSGTTIPNLNNALTGEIDELNTTLTSLISSTSSTTLTEAKTYSTNLISAYYYNENTRAANPDATGIKIESDNASITFHVDDGGGYLHISSTEFDNVEIPTNINNIITNSLTSYALSSDVTAYIDQQIGNINAILETI